MRYSRRAYSLIAMLGIGGCRAEERPRPQPSMQPRAAVSLIDEKMRIHDFGAVVAKPGLVFVHHYKLVNRTPNVVTISNIINEKPCCGSISYTKSWLKPGEEETVEVTLKVGSKIGEINHEAVIITEPRSSRPIFLSTRVTSYPPIRVEEATPTNTRSLLTTQGSLEAEYRVVVNGTQEAEMIDLDRLKLTSELNTYWKYRKEIHNPIGELCSASRRFVATLNSQDGIGAKAVPVVISDDATALASYMITWEVKSLISCSPRTLVLTANTGGESRKIIIRSLDGTSFSLLDLASSLSAISALADREMKAESHVMEIRIDAKKLKKAKGVIVVKTSHASVPRVEIPVFVLE